eukprot:gnl/TRDRNA2_/TRDRNA2_159486_c0_seq2.p1 gnl/TRDRNA2_/TRDRNA2_159486_c0~~gnl/TRDRNA2_/TRDRNA2_159486_c0_seq2.p1  ORF type:complete len:336 (+),score=16.99 gnl/TRDRNA2_/TRDRNA2_159486_c0_seq2:114-1010(+)
MAATSIRNFATTTENFKAHSTSKAWLTQETAASVDAPFTLSDTKVAVKESSVASSAEQVSGVRTLPGESEKITASSDEHADVVDTSNPIVKSITATTSRSTSSNASGNTSTCFSTGSITTTSSSTSSREGTRGLPISGLSWQWSRSAADATNAEDRRLSATSSTWYGSSGISLRSYLVGHTDAQHSTGTAQHHLDVRTGLHLGSTTGTDCLAIGLSSTTSCQQTLRRFATRSDASFTNPTNSRQDGASLASSAEFDCCAYCGDIASGMIRADIRILAVALAGLCTGAALAFGALRLSC